MITEDYVSFETAKLLKEKGFEGENRDWYNMEGFIEEVGVDDGIDPTAHEDIFNSIIPAPTLQMAMKWLRKEHNLGVIPYWSQVSGEFGCRIYDLTKKGSQEYHCIRGSFDGFEEPAELGIKYCLENLI